MEELKNKINQAIEEHMRDNDCDVDIKEFAEVVSLIVKEEYGQHNYRAFKDVIHTILL